VRSVTRRILVIVRRETAKTGSHVRLRRILGHSVIVPIQAVPVSSLQMRLAAILVTEHDIAYVSRVSFVGKGCKLALSRFQATTQHTQHHGKLEDRRALHENRVQSEQPLKGKGKDPRGSIYLGNNNNAAKGLVEPRQPHFKPA
jgi:hypothetical protein